MKRVAIASVLAVLVAGCGGGRDGGGDTSTSSDRDKAVAAAEAVYSGRAIQKLDLSVGPCISERLPGVEDWAADIAHDPRQDVDDDPANQCSSFQSGQTHHFVELTPEGELIRAE